MLFLTKRSVNDLTGVASRAFWSAKSLMIFSTWLPETFGQKSATIRNDRMRLTVRGDVALELGLKDRGALLATLAMADGVYKFSQRQNKTTVRTYT
jgi:hypothetical protein